MQDKEQREEIRLWTNKDKLESALMAGIHGAPELKKAEKARHLGEFRERIIKLLTVKQVTEPFIYSEIIAALQNEKAARLIINGAVNKHSTEKYRRLAASFNKPCTVINDPKLIGETGLVVASDDAVGNGTIEVEDRKTRLKRLGLSELLIAAVGKKICKECQQKIRKLDPGEAVNYRTLSWVDRLLGENCSAHPE